MTDARGQADVLVTGSSGFIGGHLLTRLVADGRVVARLDREPSIAASESPPASARSRPVDIRDAEAVHRAFATARPEIVYHLAGQPSVAASMRDPAGDIEANVIGAVRVGEAAVAVGARRLVFVSTGGALYGEPAQVPVTEEAPPNPESFYGASKLAAERYLRLICANGGVELSIVRPGNVYGPAQDPYGEAGAVAIFAAKMLRGEPVTIFGDGSQQRDYVYVADMVDALVRAGDGVPATCLIGTGVLTSTREIFDQLAELIGYEREPLRAPERLGDIQRIAFDASQARELWGWAPRTPLRDGLAETVEWFRGSRAR